MSMERRRVPITAGVLAAAVALAACNDVLTVSDPERYTSDDLDEALPAVANGVEGAVHQAMDTYVVYQALLSDVYQHTGTWSGYDETDHGRFQYGTSAMDNTNRDLLRARWFAGDAEERFNRVLGEAEAATDPLMAQIHLAAGLADLYIGMAVCESPAEASGLAVSDMQILEQAVAKLTRAMQTADAAETPDYGTAAQAARARAHLMLGDYDAAAADASAIPDGFSYDARFNEQSSNWIVTVTTKTFNEAAGMMYKWWPMIDEDDDAGYMRDPWTNAPDPRIDVWFDGEIATDNLTPHYSQWKYKTEQDDIPMVHSDAMRLIEAEALAFGGGADYAGAMAILNGLRDKVGLSPLPVPGDEATMLDYLLSERFAELFMEGMRMVDLHRFGLVDEVFGALNDADRPAAGRPTKFSMTDDEALYNAGIENDLAQRCLPKT